MSILSKWPPDVFFVHGPLAKHTLWNSSPKFQSYKKSLVSWTLWSRSFYSAHMVSIFTFVKRNGKFCVNTHCIINKGIMWNFHTSIVILFMYEKIYLRSFAGGQGFCDGSLSLHCVQESKIHSHVENISWNQSLLSYTLLYEFRVAFFWCKNNAMQKSRQNKESLQKRTRFHEKVVKNESSTIKPHSTVCGKVWKYFTKNISWNQL